MANTRLRPEPLCEKQTFRGIDLIKFLCAILVVSIHAAPFGQTGITLNRLLNFGTQHYLARLAVPFFFMCTGFLVFRKQPLEGFTFRTGARAAWKMYRLYLIWTVIYIPLIINKYLPGGHVTLPALVGVMDSWGVLKTMAVPVIVIMVVSTFAVMGVSAWVTQAVIRRGGRKEARK